MALQQLLEQYCLARAQRHPTEQLEIANRLVDDAIPDLIERLGQAMLDRNEARQDTPKFIS